MREIYDPTTEFDAQTANAVYDMFSRFKRSEASQSTVIDALQEQVEERRGWIARTDNPEVQEQEEAAIGVLQGYIEAAEDGEGAQQLYDRAKAAHADSDDQGEASGHIYAINALNKT
jgi:hypothetical protein